MSLYDSIIKSEPVLKGWSEDTKRCATVDDGRRYLLRVSSLQRYTARKALYDKLGQIAALRIPMCLPVEFGTCDEGVYVLQTWLEGTDAEDVVPLLPETDQYLLGRDAGEILRQIHTIPAPDNQEDWASRFSRKTSLKIEKYRACGLSFDGDDKVIAYLENNRYLLENRPQCFQHGDYHIGNMMLVQGKITIIDFDRFDYGDPWEEFNRIVWCAQKSSFFATGMLHGYFDGQPPLAFWQLLAFYIGSNTLSSIYWAQPFGQDEIDVMMSQARDVLSWYDNKQNPVPTWYLPEIYAQYVDDIPQSCASSM